MERRRVRYTLDLMVLMVGRDLKLRYRRPGLGMAWSLLNPLAQLLVFSFIFQTVLHLDIPNYTCFLFTGLLAWNWFQLSLYAATGAIVDNRELVRRPGFPVSVLPVVSVTSHLLHYLLAIPVLLVFLMLSGLPLTGAVLLLPALLAVQFIFTLSLAYLVAALHVTFRDTQYLLGLALLLGFYLTPVFYDAGALPGRFQALYGLNPLVLLLTSYRRILVQGVLPETGKLLLLSLGAAALLALSFTIFRRASDRFAEEI
jgi:lipopolysaccharide transport system permease protein